VLRRHATIVQRIRKIAAIALAGVAALAALAPSAPARNAYVVNEGYPGTVSMIDTATNSVVGAPITVGGNPRGIAITPDGTRAYVSVTILNTVAVVDTQTNSVIGNIPVGSAPFGIAITPDGSRALVANLGSQSVSVINTATNTTVGTPILLGAFQPRVIAITPDGSRAYVTTSNSNQTVPINLQTNTAGSGFSVSSGPFPSDIAIMPDGSRAYLTITGLDEVSVINTHTNSTVGVPIPVGNAPLGIATTPDGRRAYVVNDNDGNVSVIDTQTNTTTGPPIPPFGILGQAPVGIAIGPNGMRAYVSNQNSNNVSVIDTQTNTVVGNPIPVGTLPMGIAITPDQPPKASLSTRGKGVKVTFKGGASSDPDGKIVTYSWDFGDGKHAQTTTPTVKHTYKKVSKYGARLTVSDGEGCPGFVFTGQTASCNGPSVAGATRLLATVKILKLKRNKDNGTATLRVRVPGKVTVKLSGKGVVKQPPAARASGLARFKQGLGTVSLRIKAKGKARRKLNRTGSVKVKVKITVRPVGGDPNIQSKWVKLVRGKP
jgi:YVTN family beta-propeller protein